MKILALSDIHDNLAALRALRAVEKNAFDVVAVAGDIGNKTAAEFFGIIASFKCPAVHVYGNWDDALPYDATFAKTSTLLHMNVVEIDGFAFAGFSGCTADWGQNPIALQRQAALEHDHRAVLAAYAEASAHVRASAHDKKAHDQALMTRTRVMRSPEYQRYRDELRLLKEEILRLNRQALIGEVKKSGVDPTRLILITHERQYRLPDDLPGLAMHLFGHQHGYSDRNSAGTRFVNVSILDQVISGSAAGGPPQNLQAGNYAVIETAANGEITARCVNLPHDAGLEPEQA